MSMCITAAIETLESVPDPTSPEATKDREKNP